MPNDAITLNSLCKELSAFLTRGKIEKIYQPENDELTFFIKNNGKMQNLVISANAVYPRIHLTNQRKENPLTASPFCMLLRKHLTNGIIKAISLLNADRIIKIDIQARNELGDLTDFYLITELMGRYSNILLLKSDFTILDAIKRIHLDQNSARPMLPNLKYTPPEQNKLALYEESLSTLFHNKKEYDENYLLNNISGISKDTAKEIIFRNSENPKVIIDLFFNIYTQQEYKPCLRFDKNDNIKDFYITEYLSLKGNYQFHATLNQCIDEYYSQKDKQIRKKSDTQEIVKLHKRLKTKTLRRIQDNAQKLMECKNAEKYKQYGELILSNLYKMKKGDELLLCDNFYTNEKERIPLDSLKNPNQNAQDYFKRYHKLKRAKEISQQYIVILKEQAEYLDSIESAIYNSQTKQEYAEIRDELLRLGNLKKPINPKKVKKQKPSSPLHIKIESYDVYVGKNNIQNNQVTFEIASSQDLWLHTKNFHGAHTIIKGMNVPERVIQKAASITAYFSQGREAGKVEVDYTTRKNVKRHKNGMTGMVTYTNFKTILVEPKNFNE